MPIASAWSGATAPVTSVIAFEGAGRFQEYAAATAICCASGAPLRRPRPSSSPLGIPPHEGEIGSAATARASSTQRELERLIDRIEVLMEEIRRLESELADPDLFRRDPEAFAACTDRLARAQPNWEGAEERWLGLASHREQVA
jgi:ABC transport system ATP-binding/permease protein